MNIQSKLFLGVLSGALSAIIVAYVLVPTNAHAALLQPDIVLCEISRSLSIGKSGEDIRCLQRYLNWAGFVVASIGPGSRGNESQYFGLRTRSAVVRWQEANATSVLAPLGLSGGTGLFGPGSFSGYVNLVYGALGI